MKSTKVDLECYVCYPKMPANKWKAGYFYYPAPYLAETLENRQVSCTTHLIVNLARKFGQGQKVRITMEAIE